MLDSPKPTVPFREYAYGELRYRMLTHQQPDEAARLLALAQEAVTARWNTYAAMATRGQ
jgi:pyruvate-ferredoxin/flavodoxin oxidoreductase